ncbi:sulfotransferase [Alteromonas sp. ASW11-19]|uniref:Sulfotransferase n=1 Tax=Alteromonas salexigens TaxID=2982530 RepID=A0ABT2VQN8_9ALTE|nr:sulfotransferase [Alteromonas salexigens]MCU7555619.1 sulfotransferase [Alteromonas salexigens]
MTISETQAPPSATGEGTLPDFIGVGAQRAGTTWLYRCLSEHPDIFMSAKKELHFFNRHFEQGLESYKANFPASETANVKVCGEITPNYYHREQALQRIKETIPDVKLFFVLREPVSRAFSQYQLYVQSDYQGLSFDEVLTKYDDVTDLSLQGKHLQRIYEIFPRENVLVLFYDDIVRSPATVVKSVFNFLDVDSSFSPSFLNKRVNRVVLPGTQKWLKKLGLGWGIELVKRSPASEWIKNAFHKPVKKADDTDFTAFSTRFKNDIDLIEKLTGRALPGWKRPD